MKDSVFPKLLLPNGFSKSDELDTTSRGCLTNSFVETENGNLYAVYFVDLVRLTQDIESEFGDGKSYVAETAIIVLPEVTIEMARNAIRRLSESSFFENLAPLKR